ncbi:MAG: hypothetical protein GY711_05640 [bacterium]|nr:hypothetical protein [bacterium]
MTFQARPRAAASLLLLPLLASAAMAQQDLFVLGRFNKIWRVDGHATATPTLVEVASWTTNGTAYEPVGLEVDPVTGDFWVLTSDWGGQGTSVSDLVRVDPATGIGTVAVSLPAAMMRGLDRRWDGKMYTIRDQEELWLIDPVAGTWVVEPLSAPVGSFWAPVAVDTRGNLLSEQASTLVTIDPLSGDVSPLPPTLPGALPTGIEIGAGSVYSVGATADLWRFDTAQGVWVELFPAWNEMSNGYDLAFSEPVDGAGYAEVCDGLPNSTGSGSTLELIGGNNASSNDLELASRQLPPNQFGYYLLSDNAASIPVGQGVLCLGFTVHRYSNDILNSGADGAVRFPLDLGQLANGLPTLPGDTYLFQFWHRDAVQGFSTSNLSDAVAVTFQ